MLAGLQDEDGKINGREGVSVFYDLCSLWKARTGRGFNIAPALWRMGVRHSYVEDLTRARKVGTIGVLKELIQKRDD